MKITGKITKVSATTNKDGITETCQMEGRGIVNHLRTFLDEHVTIEVSKLQMEIGDKA